MPFNLIWQIPARHYWEYHWLRFLLGGLDLVEHSDASGESFDHVGRYQLVLPDAIIVDTGRYSLTGSRKRHGELLSRRLDYFQEFRRRGHRVGLVHISDEEGSDLPLDIYDGFDFVLRNYGYPQFAPLPQVRIIPLGFSAEPEPAQPEPPREDKPRDIAWSFMGTVWPGGSRARMLQAMLDVPGGFIHTTPHFGRGTLSRATYRSLLHRTKFCPAPPGNRTWDTFRLYEGLEQGCLTMVERADGHYRQLLGEHALIEIGDWREAAEAAQRLLADPDQFEARRTACHAWWRGYKSGLVQQVNGFVRERMASR